MAEGFPDIIVRDLGDLVKPVETLINRIGDAVGVLWEPKQVIRIEKAKVEAARIKALGQIEIDGIKERAFNRILVEETNKQQNMEEIVALALPSVRNDAKPDEMETDWIANFFDKCRNVADSEMRILWAKILAGEANEPKRFSKRTVNSIADFEKDDAQLFSRLCSFGLIFDDGFLPMVVNHQDSIFHENALTYPVLEHLDSIGLICFSGASGYRLQKRQEKEIASYNGNKIVFEFSEQSGRELAIGSVILTKIGNELAPICGAEPVDGFIEYLMPALKKRNPNVLIEIGGARS